MKLLTIAKRRLRYFLAENRIMINKANHLDALRKFTRSVRPMATDFELIRVGSAADGGYLVPDDLVGIGPCFSPGVSFSANFELDMVKRGAPAFLADYSVDAPPVEHEMLNFQKKFLGTVDDSVYMRLSTWVEQCAGNSNDLILQMDIEGDEYQVLLDTEDDVLKRFRIIVAEVHNLEFLLDGFGFRFISLAFEKLLRHFEVVHIHPNNCSRPFSCDGCEIPPVMEFTFLRKDRITRRVPVTSFPHKLDVQNAANHPDFSLPRCWYDGPD